MKRIGLIISVLAITLVGQAQQDAMFTHYSFNTLAVNSGYAGSRNALTVTGLHRSQWVSFPGAPITQTLTVHGPVYNEKLGIGFSIINDKIGPIRSTGVNIDLAYKLRLGNGKLAFGLKGGLNVQSRRLGSEVDVNNTADQVFQADVQSDLLPNFGFGLYYSTDNFYVGASAPRLLENDFYNNIFTGLSRERRHYYLIGGAVFSVNQKKTIKFRPTAFLKITEAAPLTFDFTGVFFFDDRFWLGTMWRTTDAIGVLSGVNLGRQFSLGYSFDWSYANTTGTYNTGSHELMLRYDFIYTRKKRVLSPRYF